MIIGNIGRYTQRNLSQLIHSNIKNLVVRTMTQQKEVINEIEGDLFSAPKNYSLAHCVGADMAMGAGIAVKFRQIYGKIDELLKQNVHTGDVAILKDNNRFIYYLVTKEQSYEKPTYNSLEASLNAMKNHMNLCTFVVLSSNSPNDKIGNNKTMKKSNNVEQLALPRIGCGIDGLEWDKVKAMLQKVFGNENVQITVYNFVPK